MGDGDDDDEEDDGNAADTICGSLRSFIQIIVVSRGRGDDENRERELKPVSTIYTLQGETDSGIWSTIFQFSPYEIGLTSASHSHETSTVIY